MLTIRPCFYVSAPSGRQSCRNIAVPRPHAWGGGISLRLRRAVRVSVRRLPSGQALGCVREAANTFPTGFAGRCRAVCTHLYTHIG